VSHHVGRVHSSNNNPRSPGVIVETSSGGVEVIADWDKSSPGAITLQPADARVLAALLHAAADAVDRSRDECCRLHAPQYNCKHGRPDR
jgi:hypothetical protein